MPFSKIAITYDLEQVVRDLCYMYIFILSLFLLGLNKHICNSFFSNVQLSFLPFHYLILQLE